MEPGQLAVDTIGLVIGGWIGRQYLVITLKQRQLSMDSGLNWPWEWANSTVFTLWAIGLSFVFLIAALISGFDIAFLGILIGVPFGFFTRKIWKINTSMPDFDQKDSYEGD